MDRTIDQDLRAARIGSRYVRNAMFVGVGIAALMLVLIDGRGGDTLLSMITSWPIQAFICVVIGPLVGHWVGAWAGKKVLLQGWNAWILSPLLGFACVWLTTFLMSVVGYADEGINGWDAEHAVRDYILNPLLSVTIVGGLPILITALVLAICFQRVRAQQFGP